MDKIRTFGGGKNRISYFDVAKGILILLLIFHHYPNAMRMLGMRTDFDIYVYGWQYIFTPFFMQCFFIISGYCSSFNKNSVCFLNGLLRQLVVPYILFQTVDNTIWMFINNDVSWCGFVRHIANVPNTTLWFLDALIFCKVTIYCFKKVTNIQNITFISLLLMMLGVTIHQFEFVPNYFCFHNYLCSVFFVALGNLFKEKQKYFGLSLKYSPYIYFTVMMFLFLIHKGAPILTAHIGVTIKNIPIFLITSTSGSFAFLALCKKIGTNTLIEFFGKSSLIIYAWHFVLLYSIISIVFNYIIPTTLPQFTLYIMTVMVAEIIACSFVVYMFNTKCLKWIIGK